MPDYSVKVRVELYYEMILIVFQIVNQTQLRVIKEKKGRYNQVIGWENAVLKGDEGR